MNNNIMLLLLSLFIVGVSLLIVNFTVKITSKITVLVVVLVVFLTSTIILFNCENEPLLSIARGLSEGSGIGSITILKSFFKR